MKRVLTEEQKQHRREYHRKWQQNNKEKFSEYQRSYRERNPERLKEIRTSWNDRNPEHYKQHYIENKQQLLAAGKDRYRNKKIEMPWAIVWQRVRNRANKSNIPFLITKEQIAAVWVDVCPVLGIPIITSYKEGCGGKPSDNSPSLDRIIPELGYIEGNVRIISQKANVIKNNGTAAEHRAIADYIDKYTPIKQTT